MSARHDILRAQEEQGRLRDAGEFPRVVLIDTVSLCNLRCSMCVHKEMTRPRGVMEWGLFTRIVDEIARERKDARVWMVFFGEALIIKRRSPSIFDMISYAKGSGLEDVVMNTNATLLDEKAATRLAESGLDALYVGLDAFSPETYARIRVGGEYRSTVRNVLQAVRAIEAAGTGRPRVVVQFVEMEANRHERDDFIRFWRARGVTVKVRPMVSWAGHVRADNLVLGNEERWPCHWALQTMSVTNTGRVVLCAVDLDAGFVTGDATSQSLKEVWNGKLAELRRLHLEGRFEELPVLCRDCRDWQSARADFVEPGGEAGPEGRGGVEGF